VGFEVTTPRPLALRLARPLLAAEGVQSLDSFDQQALLDEAIDGALANGPDAGLGELSEGVGFREALQEAVTTLRLSGLTPTSLRERYLRDGRKKLFLVRLLERYETLLAERRRADTAAILTHAIQVLGSGGKILPASLGVEILLLTPGLGTRGLPGRFLEALRGCGGRLIETDAVVGLPSPPSWLWEEGEPAGALSFLNEVESAPANDGRIEMFRAASITDELREVLRRVVDAGLPWDEVEIVTPDAAAYGSALHALASRLGIPVTYAVGLPVERTRTGRAVRSYLDWIEGGFQASPIRRLLEAGDLRPTRSNTYRAPGDLARRFRQLRIGWGRRRYRTEIRSALEALDTQEAGPWQSPEGFERQARRARGELEALRSILFPALKATPSVPDRAIEAEGGEPVSPAELAGGLRAFLRRVPRGRGPDAAAREEILRILERIEVTLRRRTRFEAAVTIVRRHLQIRVRAPERGSSDDPDGGTPWRSEGGHLHLSDFEHGGFSGRKAFFIVGLDADRVPGGDSQGPVLTDSDRRSLSEQLPTSSEIGRERTFRLAALLARLRGRVTLSYGAWNAATARSVAPSPVLLQALRLRERDETLTFSDLHSELGAVACAIPPEERSPLDSDDVWLGALSAGGVLKAGDSVVRATFGDLDRGLSAQDERRSGVPGPFHGVVSPRPELFDPRRNADVVLSASRLEDLGACPLRYLFKNVLRLRPPDDPTLDPDRWLDPLQRGSLLHRVYERTLARAKSRGAADTDASLEPLALEVLAEEAAKMRAQVPAPGEGVRQRQLVALEEDVRSFVRMVRDHGAPWIKAEMKFGLLDDEPVSLRLERGMLRVRGAIDRVDETLEGLQVVDYKTGVPYDYEGSTGVFNGGRRLQHALYAEVAERILGREVKTGSYHFPTRRGQNRIIPFERSDLIKVGGLLDLLLGAVESGAFVPTDEAGDCRFCDFAQVCRSRSDEYGKVVAPLAEWSKELMAVGLQPAFAHMKRARGYED
jgi:ATP-dependent helicase/nuclease subunit B